MKVDVIGWGRRHINLFCESPRRYIDTYGGNLAGHCWNSGSGLQFLLGSVTLSGREVVAGCINLTSGAASQFFGHTKWGIPVTAALGFIGTLITLYPSLEAGEGAVWFSFISLALAQSLGIINEYLTKRFAGHPIWWLRETLGHPRRTAGLFLGVLLSRVPLLFDCVMQQRWKLLAATILWTLGDLFYGLSKPVAARLNSQSPSEVNS